MGSCVSYEYVLGKVSEALGNVMSELQDQYGIKTGDCEPYLTQEYNNSIEDVALSVTMILRSQLS